MSHIGEKNMSKIKIVGDSTLDLSKELYEKYDMDIVPLNVSFGQETFKDGVSITRDQLYKDVEKYKSLPATSAPGPQVFEEVFRKWLDQGYEVIYIGIGSTLSTAFQSANIAKNSIDSDKIYLVDSKNLSSGSGLLALKAGKLIKEGKSAAEIVKILEKDVPNVVAQFNVETLDYLHKGGRCSGTAKVLGHLLHIRPHILVKDGKLIVYKKPRGNMKVAIEGQIEELKNALPNVQMDNIMITDSGVTPEIRDYFVKQVSKYVDPKIIRPTPAGCVIASHCGPGTIGLLFIKD